MEEEDLVRLVVSHSGTQYEVSIPADATLAELQAELEDLTELPPAYQKLMIPKHGMAKPEDADLRLRDVFGASILASNKPTKLMLIGTKPAVADVMKSLVSKPRLSRNPRISAVARNANKRRAPDSETLKYTFHKLIPLPFLPNPEKSLAFLERLKADRGVQQIMVKYKWSVPVLTEMDPASNTSHDHKVLGLNRGMGQVIELRLRTDDYEGWRDYKTVRRTLCHELAHNVHSPGHPPEFWELTKKLEREVVGLNPFGSGGHQLSNEEFYSPPEDEDEYQDGGGWEGGAFVLGSGESSSGNGVLTTLDEIRNLSQRELILRAVEQRNARKRTDGSSPGN